MLKKVFNPEDCPLHPGEILREEFLPALEMSRSAFARHIGISPRTLSELLGGQRIITFDLAQRLGCALGTGARYWLGLQAQYDFWRAEQPGPIGIRPVAWRKSRAEVDRSSANAWKVQHG